MGVRVVGQSSHSRGSHVICEVTDSPWTFQNTFSPQEMVIVDGGIVSSVDYSRGGEIFHNLMHTKGWFLVNNQDMLRITYTVKPTVIRYPM